VYDLVAGAPKRSYIERAYRFHNRDPLAGKLYVFILTLLQLLYLLLVWLRPAETIDKVPEIRHRHL